MNKKILNLWTRIKPNEPWIERFFGSLSGLDFKILERIVESFGQDDENFILAPQLLPNSTVAQNLEKLNHFCHF